MPRTSRPSQGVGNGLFLDRRRRFVAGRLYGVEHFLAQAEFIKSHCVSLEQGFGRAAFGAHGDGAAFPGRALAWRICNGSRRVGASVTPLTWARYSGIPAKVNETRRFCVIAPRRRTSPAEDWLTRAAYCGRRWGTLVVWTASPAFGRASTGRRAGGRGVEIVSLRAQPGVLPRQDAVVVGSPMFSRLKIASKLLIGYGSILLLVACISALGYAAVVRGRAALDDVAHFKTAEALEQRLEKRVLEARMHFWIALQSNDPKQWTKSTEGFAVASDWVADLQTNTSESARAQEVQKMADLVAKYRKLANRLRYAQTQDGSLDAEKMKAAAAEATGIEDSMTALGAQLATEFHDAAEASYAAASDSAALTQRAILGAGGARPAARRADGVRLHPQHQSPDRRGHPHHARAGERRPVRRAQARRRSQRDRRNGAGGDGVPRRGDREGAARGRSRAPARACRGNARRQRARPTRGDRPRAGDRRRLRSARACRGWRRRT